MKKILLFICLAGYIKPGADRLDPRNKSLGGKDLDMEGSFKGENLKAFISVCEAFAKQHGAGSKRKSETIIEELDC